MIHPQSSPAPAVSLHSSADPLQFDSGLVLPYFLPTDDPLESFNKALAFMCTTFASSYPSNNNQLETSSNPMHQVDMSGRKTLIRVEVPKELPKVSLVITSVKRLKNHIASFDKVMKVRTTPDAITARSWGFEHTKKVFNEEVIPFKISLQTLVKDFENGLLNELNEVKTVFNQMEDVVDQCSTNKKLFEIEKKELKLENEPLLEHIICQDVVNIVMHADVKSVNVLHV
ncbi:hypothetical protein Tco_0281704 [Tanacetum coccineum]